jgi:D-serine dehydratase
VCQDCTQERKISSLAKLILDFNSEMQELEHGKTYRYLGTEESEGIQHPQMKGRLKKEYTRILRMILKSELNISNKIRAIGALGVFVLIYSFDIIN